MRAINRKNNAAIVRMVDQIPGTMRIDPDSFKRAGDNVVFTDLGCGVDVDWDGMEQAQRDGQNLFMDELGELVSENELTLIETPDTEP